MDPAVKKETGYTAVWVAVLSLVMEAVFLLVSTWSSFNWDFSVLFGNLGGAALAVGNFFLMAVIVSKAIDKGKPEQAAAKVKATASLRLIVVGALAALLIGVFHTNVYATLIPLLFPRIALLFRPMIDRKRGVQTPGSEGSEID